MDYCDTQYEHIMKLVEMISNVAYCSTNINVHATITEMLYDEKASYIDIYIYYI